MTTKLKTQEKHKMSEIDEHILKYFDVKKRLGKGAYGIVWKAIDKKTNQTLAVKKIFDAFRDETDAQRTFREIMFLRAFRHHPNVIQLNNVYRAANNLDIYLSFEFMESDLHNVIKKGNILKDVHKRYIMYQLLNAVKYIHSGNVIHRDLKPSNILIDTKCRCKLADFGLARSVSNQQIRDSSDSNEFMEPVLTDYVATRWYRAPEILVASKRYTKGIDMWSLGCILGEMIRGKPIFQGSSTVNQIEKIVSALPEITEQDIIAVGGGFGTALLNKHISNNSSSTTLDELLIDGSSDANNLVKSLLILDPLARLTATEALNHCYVERFRHSVEETELNVDVQPPFRDDVRLSVTEYRSKLYEIVQQTEKSNMEKPSAYSRKREPKTNNKSVDSNPSKLNVADHKPKRSVYRSQERKSNIPNHEAITAQKVVVNSRNNKIHIITPPAANSGTIPKPQNIVNTNVEQNQSQNSAKFQAMLSKTKLVIKPTIRHVTKNTISTPEIHSMLQTTSNCSKYVMDKRHSVDGSCGYATISGIKNSQTSQHLENDRHSNQIHNSYSLRNKNIPLRGRRSSQTFCYTTQKPDRPSSESTTNAMKRTDEESNEDMAHPNDECNYYEKRLKNLEMQIEKHKRDVKAFCSENVKYSQSRELNRNTDLLSEQQVSYKNKYSLTSAGNGKTLQLLSKTSSNCRENRIRHDMNNDFQYMYNAGDNIDNRQEIPSRYYKTSRTHS